MKNKIEYVLQLPWKIDGDKFYFFAEDDLDAAEILQEWLQPAQDVCEHKNFKNGKCTECQWECDHDDREDHCCLFCGSIIIPDYDDRNGDAMFSESKEREKNG